MEHKITIGIPVYNRTDFFREALESALNQTVRCPVLIIDNNSPHDEFKKIIDEYNDPLISYVKTDHTVPQDENFNNCFRYAETPWVTVLHDDDLLHCQYVEFCHKIMDEYGDQVEGITYRSFVSDKVWDDINKKRDLTDDIKIIRTSYHFFNTLVFPGVLVLKDLALEIGGFKSGLLPIADVDFWYRYGARTRMFIGEQEMSYYRISPSQSTNQLIERMINNVYKYRLNLLKEHNANNFLNRLALEYTRLINIKYFKDTYPGLEIDDIVIEKQRLNRARKLMSIGLIKRMVNKFVNYQSFKKPKKK